MSDTQILCAEYFEVEIGDLKAARARGLSEETISKIQAYMAGYKKEQPKQ